MLGRFRGDGPMGRRWAMTRAWSGRDGQTGERMSFGPGHGCVEHLGTVSAETVEVGHCRKDRSRAQILFGE
jgi:hypothetical protein